MFHPTRPSPSATRMVLTLAAAAALSAGPVVTAAASRVPDPSTVQTTQIGWQTTVTGLAAEARSTSSLAARRMLHSELTIIMHSHRAW